MTSPKFGICEPVMMNGVEYTVVDRHWSPFLHQWLYDLRETAGDGENNDMCEDILASLATHADYTYERVIKELDEIRKHLFTLGEAIHKEIDHIESMQKCRTFDVMAKDLAESHATVAHANSVRCWIENRVHKIARIMEHEDEGEEKES